MENTLLIKFTMTGKKFQILCLLKWVAAISAILFTNMKYTKSEAINVLSENGIDISVMDDILFPRYGHFIDEVHDAVEFLMEEHGFGIKYI